MPNIAIIYCGSQLLKPLVDSCISAKVSPFVLPNDTPLETLQLLNIAGVIITGGSTSVRSLAAPKVDTRVYEAGLPVLGICYGMQRMAHDLGGTVLRAPQKLEGEEQLQPEAGDVLTEGLTLLGTPVWMSHSYFVSEVPDGFGVVASTDTCAIAAMHRGQLFGVQFHPEKPKSGGGRHILHNFLRLCL